MAGTSSLPLDAGAPMDAWRPPVGCTAAPCGKEVPSLQERAKQLQSQVQVKGEEGQPQGPVSHVNSDELTI